MITLAMEPYWPQLRAAYLSPSNPNGNDHIYTWIEKELGIKLKYKKLPSFNEIAAELTFDTEEELTMFALKWA